MLSFIFLLNLAVLATSQNDPASRQLYCYKQRTNNDSVGIITTSAGAPVDYDDAYNVLNKKIINNEYFVDAMSHVVRERIPVRVVHEKGNGACGYFEVTNDISHISKAKLFSKIGERTPTCVRFSNALGFIGSPDTTRNLRGFAIKFYTKEGNFDIVGFNTPVYIYKNPVFFPSIVHSTKKNPVTYLLDYNAFWDFFLAVPETYHILMYYFSDVGIPYSYRHMPGNSIHTYQFMNNNGKIYFGRFYFIPDEGVKNMTAKQAKKVACDDPDYYGRDLYNAIQSCCNPPSWTVKLQIFTMKDIEKDGANIFDVTRIVNTTLYKLTTVGKLVLNKNPKNFFANVEQSAYCTSNLVPGICGAPDKLFEARRLFYREAQNYRLGANFKKIYVNRPKSKVDDYTRDGVPPVGRNGGDKPNYYPNTFHGSIARKEKNKCKLIKIKQFPETNNMDQMREFYQNLSEAERKRLAEAIVETLSLTVEYLQKKGVRVFGDINPELGSRVSEELERKEQKLIKID